MCSIEGCERNVHARGWCFRHYQTWRRHGDPTAAHVAEGYTTRRGYRAVYRRDHPLANGNGSVLEHRAVLFDRIGPGGHACYHCAVTVSWEGGSLEADHLDWNRQNNDPANLVPSCHPCNVRRRRPRLVS
jgi:hypothetical protein